MKIKGTFIVVCMLCVAVLLGACAPTAAAPAKAVAGNPTYESSLSPANGSVIGEKRPEISWTVYPNGHAIGSFKMTLDGQPVAAERKNQGNGIRFSFKPQTDLAPGSHTAAVSIAFGGFQPLTLVSQFTITSNPVNPHEGKDNTQLKNMEAEAVAHLNVIRATLGLAQLKINPALTTAAQSHSNFMQLNNATGHYQNSNYPGFTGVKPQDRATFFGYSGLVGEGIDYGTGSPRMSVEGLLDAPYHRMGLINPNAREAGVGFSLQPYNMVVNTGWQKSDDDRVMLYPYPGQTDAKASWFVAESPNPLASYGKDRVYVGYPISLSFHDAKTREFRLTSASLTDSSGKDVSHYVVDSSRDSESKKHVFLIPRQSLVPGTTYQVKINGQRLMSNGASLPVAADWSFTVGKDLAIDYLGIINTSGVENLAVKLKNGDVSDLSYLLIRNGVFVRKYKSAEGYSWTNAEPLAAGKYRLQLAAPSISAELIEYIIEVQEAAGKKQVSVVSKMQLGQMPKLRVGLLELGGREYIDLFWQEGKPAAVSYELKQSGKTVRSYKDGRYYAQQGTMLANGDYMLHVSRGGAGQEQFVLSIYKENGERRVSLTPVR